MKVEIKQETADNKNEVYEVNRTAFGRDGEAKLVDLLRESASFVPELSLIAMADNTPIGHILFSKIIIVDETYEEFESLALAPMAVLPEFQRKGVGGQLIEHGLERARELGFKSVIVLGHDHYYPKFGFVPAMKWNIMSPYDVPDSNFMALELVAGGLQGVSGVVKYPSEFESV